MQGWERSGHSLGAELSGGENSATLVGSKGYQALGESFSQTATNSFWEGVSCSPDGILEVNHCWELLLERADSSFKF